MMQEDFVIFMSPGTFVAETTKMPIDSWDVEKVKTMTRGIKERYGATPYGFYFVTFSRKDDELDSKVTKQSNMYYLGGKVETLEEVEARATKDDDILISNMKGNGWNRIITNTNSWKITLPLKPGDIVLN